MNQFKKRVLDEKLSLFERLTVLMEILRSEKGCAWDKKQTHKSLIPYLIEESYEVVEAIENEDNKQLAEELGDLLCQVVFHAQIAKEAGNFDVNDSIRAIINKLIERHPHIFEVEKKLSPQEVRDQWEQIKRKTNKKKKTNSTFAGIPRSMPALTMAYRVGEKAGGLGFDWKNKEDVLLKIEEEFKEIQDALKAGKTKEIEEEIGDLLFATASLARKCKIDPETALKKALNKFIRRFEKMEKEVESKGKDISDLDLNALEAIWKQLK